MRTHVRVYGMRDDTTTSGLGVLSLYTAAAAVVPPATEQAVEKYAEV